MEQDRSEGTVLEPPELSEADRAYAYSLLQKEQSFLRGAVGGSAAAVVGASVWALISYKTGYQIGYMATALGVVVGFTVRYSGKGLERSFQYLGAALALCGCILGNVLVVYALVAAEKGLSIMAVASMIPLALLPRIVLSSIDALALLFYALAFYAGYVYSRRKLADYELREKLEHHIRNPG